MASHNVQYIITTDAIHVPKPFQCPMICTLKQHDFVPVFSIEHYENKIFGILKMRLDLVCSSPVYNKHAFCKNAKQLGRNQSTLSDLGFVPLVWHSTEWMFVKRWFGAFQVRSRFATVHIA